MSGISSLTAIGNGLAANDGTGDALRSGADKINGNNTAIVTAVNNLAASQAGGMISYLLKSDMNADLAHADGVLATVTNDPTDANNAVYRKSGASGSGSWVLTIDRVTIMKNDLASTATGKGASLVGFLQVGTGAIARTTQGKMQEIEVSITDYGAQPAPFDSTSAFTEGLAFLATVGGGRLRVPHGSWICNGQQSINSDNVHIVGDGMDTTTITRMSGSGYMFYWASTNDTNGGGITNCTLVGVNTVGSGAGIGVGSSVYYANRFIANHVRCDSWGQYGFQVYNGNDFIIDTIRVTNHGPITGSISSCIGFGVFPRLASSGGTVSNIYSEIGAACQANSGANTAAIKLQTHQRFRASNLFAVGGSEECVSIDSIDGEVRDITLIPQGSHSGLAVGNQNTAHTFSGQTFVLDGIKIVGSNPYGLTISGDGTNYRLTGCTIRNIYAPLSSARFLNYAAYKNCVFENWLFGEIRFSHFTASSTPPTSITNDGNILRNIMATCIATTSPCALEVSNSFLSNFGVSPLQGATAGTVVVTGSLNMIKTPVSVNSSGTAISIVGSTNTVYDPSIINSVGKALFFPAGSNNNVVFGGDLTAGTGLSDSGSGNIVEMLNRRVGGNAAPTTGTWLRGDVVYNGSPTASGFVGWVCILSGSPGTWKTFGAISA